MQVEMCSSLNYPWSINEIPESKNCQPWPWKAKLPQFRRRQELTKKLFTIKSNSQTLLHSIGQVTTRAQRGSGVGLQLLVLRKWGERHFPQLHLWFVIVFSCASTPPPPRLRQEACSCSLFPASCLLFIKEKMLQHLAGQQSVEICWN